MNKKQRYCFLAFGELALDVTYDENGIISESGGVSAFNGQTKYLQIFHKNLKIGM